MVYTGPGPDNWGTVEGRFLAGISDTTAPTAPGTISPSNLAGNSVDLGWAAATDNESNIIRYNVYRNNTQIGTSSTTNYSDSGLSEGTSYSYQVSAVNGAGLEGPKSAVLTVSTTSDSIAPTLVSASASGATAVTVVFSEAVNQADAETHANYSISPTISISAAVLGSDQKTVTLTTGSLSEGTSYTLTVNNIRDRASSPNTISANSQDSFDYQAQLIVSTPVVATGKQYLWVDGVDPGNLVYIDRSFSYSTVPSAYTAMKSLQTANVDKAVVDANFLSFTANMDVNVYVAHALSSNAVPTWLSSWTDTGDTLVTSDRTLKLYKKAFAAGSITLGDNGSGGSMYVVLVEASTGGSPPPPPPPPAPTVSLSASATSVAYNGSSTLSWSTTNADSCTASGAWSGSKGTAGSETQSGLTADSNYSLSCTGAGGNANDAVSITVAAAASDSDNDGLPDSWEQSHFGNLDRDGSGDQDGDGLSDLAEYGYDTNPTLSDSDGDGDSDQAEITYGSDPTLGTDTLNSHRPATPQILAIGNNVSIDGHTFVVSGFSDPDSNAQLGASQWQIGTDSGFGTLMLGRTLDNTESLVISQGVLKSAASYAIRSRHQDNSGLWSDWSATATFTTASSEANDVDGNGIDDRYQVSGPVDTDNNAVNDADESMCNLTDVDGSQALGFRSNAGSVKCSSVLNESDLPPGSTSADFPFGMFSFGVEGLPIDPANPATVNLTVYFAEPLAANTRWYKYDPSTGEVTDFSSNVSFNGNEAVVTLTDGGLGDADGVVNGTIVDPSGPSFTASSTTGGSSSGGGGGAVSLITLGFFYLLKFLLFCVNRRSCRLVSE
jgi:hypothetical protein